MASKSKLLGGLVVLVVMLFASAVLAAGYVEHAATDTQGGGEYWTKERMMNAKPMLKVLQGTPKDLNKPIVYEGPVRKSNSSNAGSLSQATEDQLIEMSGTLGGIDEESFDLRYTYPPPYTVFAVPVAWYTILPYQQTGKVFMTFGSSNYVCSGSSIGGRLVLSAGHCVNEGGSNGTTGAWAKNWRFVPAYYKGAAPFGIWTAQTLVTTTDWASYGSLCRDYSFVVTKKISGKKLSQVVGWLGIMTSADRLQHWTQLGYPAAAPFAGNKMWQTEASYNGQDAPGCEAPYTTGKGFGQTGGSSGGPWIVKYTPGVGGSTNYANSVTSYIYTAEPKQIFGPYFDSLTYYMWNKYRVK
jgi:hypothetical protein